MKCDNLEAISEMEVLKATMKYCSSQPNVRKQQSFRTSAHFLNSPMLLMLDFCLIFVFLILIASVLSRELKIWNFHTNLFTNCYLKHTDSKLIHLKQSEKLFLVPKSKGIKKHPKCFRTRLTIL